MVDNLYIFNFKICMREINNNNIIFFKKTITLLVLLIIMDIVFGKLLEYFFFKMKTGQTARTTYVIREATEKLIIFGSSRATHHYVSDILEDSLQVSTYNAGRDGEGMLYSYAIFKNMELRSKPSVIILDLRIGEFDRSDDDYTKLSVLLPYYNYSKDIRTIVNLRSSTEPFKTMSYLYRYNSLFLTIVLNNIIYRADSDRKGYIPLYKTLSPSFKAIPVIEKKIELDTTKINIFKSFIKAAKNANCKIFVFVSPSLQKTNSASIKIGEQICNQEDVTFINLSQSSYFMIHPEYFQDESHLNNNGAEIYTRMVYTIIR